MDSKFKPTYIDGKPYAVRLLTGGVKEGYPNEWDAMMSDLGDRDKFWHWKNTSSFCQETFERLNRECAILRGDCTACYRTDFHANGEHSANIGFRPVLVPLNPDTLTHDPSQLPTISDGCILLLGALYMNDTPLSVPQNTTWETGKDIPNYIPGAKLRIGDMDAKFEDKLIRWVKWNGLLVADRNLLQNISWDELNAQGLVFGTMPTAPKSAAPAAAPSPLSHVMLIPDVERFCGSVLLGTYCILYNGDKVSEDEAVRIADSGDYSPYVLMLPKAQYEGLFLNLQR